MVVTDPSTIPWIEKYRPQRLEDMTQSENLVNFFQNSITTGNISHYLFYGPPGTGKTSAILAIGRELFKEHFSSRVIEFNASDDRGINAVRDKITKVAKKSVSEIRLADGSCAPPYKIIILDEADSLTEEAQDALRVIIEQYSKVTRFCFICNYISKITDAIKSRCAPVFFRKLSVQCVKQKLKEIAKAESMDLPEPIIQAVIEISNGDMRKAIMLMQNLKYLYQYNSSMRKPFKDMTLEELGRVSTLILGPKRNYDITDRDVHQIAASISPATAHTIIKRIMDCRSIIKISELSKEIIAWSYPIDTVLTQINNAVLSTDLLDDEQKATIIHYSGHIFLRMKECANEHIQLTDYMACIYGVNRGLSAYKPVY